MLSSILHCLCYHWGYYLNFLSLLLNWLTIKALGFDLKKFDKKSDFPRNRRKTVLWRSWSRRQQTFVFLSFFTTANKKCLLQHSNIDLHNHLWHSADSKLFPSRGHFSSLHNFAFDGPPYIPHLSFLPFICSLAFSTRYSNHFSMCPVFLFIILLVLTIWLESFKLSSFNFHHFFLFLSSNLYSSKLRFSVI